jgi:hypothetical protein
MHPHTTYELVKMHQSDLLAAAEHARLAREARRGSRGTDIPARRPFAWLRGAAASVATRISTFRRAQAANH